MLALALALSLSLSLSLSVSIFSTRHGRHPRRRRLTRSSAAGSQRSRRPVNERVEDGIDVGEQIGRVVFDGGETNEHDGDEGRVQQKRVGEVKLGEKVGIRGELAEEARDAMLAQGLAQPPLTILHPDAHRRRRRRRWKQREVGILNNQRGEV